MAAPNTRAEPVGTGSFRELPTVSRADTTKSALARLRTVASNHELADRVPIELCRAGFGRVLFSLVRSNTWVVRSAHTPADARIAAALLEVGQANPRRLCRPLPESEMLHSRQPILIEDPQSDPRLNSPLVAIVKPDVYVAAAVHVWDTPVALLHADAPTHAGDVGPADRDALGIFAEGLGVIMERNIVLDRMQTLVAGAEEHSRLLNEMTDAFSNHPGGNAISTPTEQFVNPPAAPVGGDIAQWLTRREVQVLNLLAAGKTNAQIGARLFISEGTVKSHLRHIMDKLGAANRTEAVARYREQTRGAAPSSRQI